MGRPRGVSILGICLLIPVAAVAAKPVPTVFPEADNLKLGDTVLSFQGQFSAKELETTTRGRRTFAVNTNSLPAGVESLRCEFQDNRLVYVEAVKDHDEGSWTSWVASPIGAYGAPKT